MKMIKTDTINGIVSVPVYHYTEIPYTQIMLEAKESKKRSKGGKGISYLEIPCAFDIETTNVYERDLVGNIDDEVRPYAFMYHWQFCIGYRVVFGRYWAEFQKMLRMIEKNMNLSNNLRLVVYVHNLAFEMQFMRRFIKVTDSFCKDDRKPLKVVVNGCIEFRCSAALSNNNLMMFCKNENATFYKLTDTFDYDKVRTPTTKLTEEEEGYCYNDVRGLCECIQSYMRFDTLAEMPLTNTGYVRRDARTSMRKNPKNRRMFKDSALTADLYKHVRAAFRGGDTHASAIYANQILTDVTSFDISSSYPACMMINTYPLGKFEKIQASTMEKLRSEEPDKYCYLLHVAFEQIAIIATHNVPYIPLAKCKHVSNDRVLDNGRIVAATELTMWITDVDMDIITKEYYYKQIRIESVYAARKGKLPEEYRNIVLQYFEAKTRLKGLKDADSIYNYMKAKNRLNSLYGMMCMRIDLDEHKYDGMSESGYTNHAELLETQLEVFYKSRNSFIPYQWGIWVTACARYRLHEMMWLIGRDLAYVDTDSCKFINVDSHLNDIKKLNERLTQEAIDNNALAVDKNGETHYMGVYEYDGFYNKFKSLGAKKYVVQMGDECYSTIAGVSKKAGQNFFNEQGIDAFKLGAVIKDSGHLVAYYNDDNIHQIDIDGEKIWTASNVALLNNTYTIGITDDYRYLLQNALNKYYDMG